MVLQEKGIEVKVRTYKARISTTDEPEDRGDPSGSKGEERLTIIPTGHQGRTSSTPTARPSAGSKLSFLEIHSRGWEGRYRRSAQGPECQEGEEQHRGGRGKWWRHAEGCPERVGSCADKASDTDVRSGPGPRTEMLESVCSSRLTWRAERGSLYLSTSAR